MVNHTSRSLGSPSQPADLRESDILNALRDCYDPGIPLNIVDLGLVHSVQVEPDPNAPGSGIPGVPPRHRVRVELSIAQIADPDDSPLPALIQNRLAAFETISRTEVAILREPAWNPGRISDVGRARLAGHLTSQKPSDALIQIQIKPAKPND